MEYLPENYQIIAPQGTGTNALEASLMLLQESLDSGAALAQFEVGVKQRLKSQVRYCVIICFHRVFVDFVGIS